MHDFLVIGGGVVGMTTARELAIRGFKVALFDKSEPGREASWAAGGILSSMRPWAEHPASAVLSNAGRQDYSAFCDSLHDNTGIDPEYIVSGLLMAGSDDIDKTATWAQQNGIVCRQGQVYLPRFLSLPADAILLPDIAQVRPNKLVQALKTDLTARRVEMFANSAVESINISHGRFQSINTASYEFTGMAVIVCAGAWSARLLQQLNIDLGIVPVCGQMLCMQLADMMLDRIVLDGGHYLIPRNDGQFLVGSNMEYTGFNKETTATVKQELLDWALATWPESHNARLVSHWAGLRPGSEKGHPFIGAVPGTKGVYMNTAHFRKGILQAVPSARLLADYILEQEPFIPVEPYMPAA